MNLNIQQQQQRAQQQSDIVEFMKPNGNFMFHTMIEFNKVFSIIYFFSEIALFVYKDVNLHYPPNTISVEITCLVFFLIVQLVRFYLGALGNRSETSIYVMFCLVFIIVPLYTFVQFLVLQTYVLYIEIIINGIGISLTAIELVFCLLSMMAISSQEKTM